MSGRYASDTTVSVEKSRAELEALLRRYGGNAFAYMSDDKQAIIGFRVKTPEGGSLAVKMTLPLPSPKDRRFTHTPGKGLLRDEASAFREWEQACRSRWRALVLVVKAKLEACVVGISTVEREFLADIVLPNGRTLIQHLGEDVRRLLATGDSTIQLALPSASGAA